MPIGTDVGLGPGNIVLYGDPAPPPKGAQPLFLAYVCCGQKAGLFNMPLGTEVSLGPGHSTLDGGYAFPRGAKQPAQPRKGSSLS